MQYVKQELLYSGKVKSLFKTNDPQTLWVEFRDDTTAFNGIKHEKLARKGEVNNKINTYIMQLLEKSGVPTHLKKIISPTEALVKHLTMIPLESVVRNVAAGSLCKRLGIEFNQALKPPLQEFFLKDDALGDPLINDNHALTFAWATREQLAEMRRLTFEINIILTDLFAKAGMILVDAKYEFGLADGKMYLGDEISPDSCRIWDADTKKPLDKDRFRQDLGEVVESYQIIAERLGVSVKA